MTQQKTVLVAPLNWGLGHATRLVPVIELLLSRKVNVLLAADKRPYDFLKYRFPDCEIIRLPGYEPYYPEKGSMAFNMLLTFPYMLAKARKAKRILKEIINRHGIDLIISDNRYELSSNETYCVFITHQLSVQTFGWQRLFQPLITRLIYRHIKKFDELWIPDYKDRQRNLSGRLSHIKTFPIENYHFTGPLSRFNPDDKIKVNEETGLLVILSGPEPQRTVFEQLITKQLLQSKIKATVLQGKPGEYKTRNKKNITCISHADDRQMATLIKSAEIVLSRPGYSTIMDLSVFGKKAIFVPTPGQTEQIYLAREVKKRGYCYFEEQASFNMVRAIEMSKKYAGLPQLTKNKKLDDLVGKLLSRIQDTPSE